MLVFRAALQNICNHQMFRKLPKLWHEKIQNKTKWCVTKWICTEDWVLNTEKLAELRKI
ncbi:hypothetical protein AAHE18_01G239600 [Arachis hypogaea]